MKKMLNLGLLGSFLITMLVPLTGLHIHKLASLLFLLLTLIHAIVYRRKSGTKRWLLLALIMASFVTGLLGMLPEQYPLMLTTHRALSLGVVFFSAIHIFVFHKRL